MKSEKELQLMITLMLPYLGVQGCWLFASFAVASAKGREEFLAECASIYDEVAAIGELGDAIERVVQRASEPPSSMSRPRGSDEPEGEP